MLVATGNPYAYSFLQGVDDVLVRVGDLFQRPGLTRTSAPPSDASEKLLAQATISFKSVYTKAASVRASYLPL